MASVDRKTERSDPSGRPRLSDQERLARLERALAQLAIEHHPALAAGQTAVPDGIAQKERARMAARCPDLVGLLAEPDDGIERRPDRPATETRAA